MAYAAEMKPGPAEVQPRSGWRRRVRVRNPELSAVLATFASREHRESATVGDLVIAMGDRAFGALMFLVNIPLAFLVPSTSGHAALAIPILAPLADFAGVDRAMVVTAYQSASGLVNLITPTSAVVMGGLALAKVRVNPRFDFVYKVPVPVGSGQSWLEIPLRGPHGEQS